MGWREARAAAALADAAYKRAEGGPSAVARALAGAEGGGPRGLVWAGVQLPRDGLTQPYIVAEERGCPRCLFVALRGTKELADVLADAGVLMAPLAPGAAGPLGRAAAHRGFLSRARGLPLAWLAEAARARGRGLVLCGHSLGGAVAALATALLLVESRGPPPAVCCVAFAAPPVGNSAFARHIEASGWINRFQTFLLPEDFVPRSLALLAPKAAGARPGGAGSESRADETGGEGAGAGDKPRWPSRGRSVSGGASIAWTSAAKFVSAYRHAGQTLYLPPGGAVCTSLDECKGTRTDAAAGEGATPAQEDGGGLLDMKFHRMAAYSERVRQASLRGQAEGGPGQGTLFGWWWDRLRRPPFGVAAARAEWKPREGVPFVALVPGFAVWAARGCFPVALAGKTPVPGEPRRRRLVLYLSISGFESARPETTVRVGGLRISSSRIKLLGPTGRRPSPRPALVEVEVWLPEKVAVAFDAPETGSGRGTPWQPPPVSVELRNDFHDAHVAVNSWHSAPPGPAVAAFSPEHAAATDEPAALLQPAL